MESNTEFLKNARSIHRLLMAVSAAILLFAITPRDTTETSLHNAKHILDEMVSEPATASFKPYFGDAIDRIASKLRSEVTPTPPELLLPFVYREPQADDCLAAVEISATMVAVFVPEADEIQGATLTHRDLTRISFGSLSGPRKFPIEIASVGSVEYTSGTSTDLSEEAVFELLTQHLKSEMQIELSSELGEAQLAGGLLEPSVEATMILDNTPDSNIRGRIIILRLERSNRILDGLKPCWDLIKAKEPAEAITVVDRELAKYSPELSLVGMKVDGRSFGVAAPIITFLVMLHLYVHLSYIDKKIKTVPRFPWMVLFTDRASRILSLVSLFVLPLISNLWLLWRNWDLLSFSSWIGIVACCALGVLGCITSRIADHIASTPVPITAPDQDIE